MIPAARADRDELVAHARVLMAKAPARLAVAAGLLPKLARERAWLLHGWWWACDGFVADPDGLIQIRRLTASALAGVPTGEVGFDGLAIVAAECGFTWVQIADVITGFELRATGHRPVSETELLSHAYYIAGAPAVSMVRAMGIAEDDGEMLDCACALGVGLWLRAAAADKRHVAGLLSAKHLRRLAASYLRSARYGTAHLRFRCRWAVCTLLAPWPQRWVGLVMSLPHGPADAALPLARADLAAVKLSPDSWLEEESAPPRTIAETAARVR